MNSGRGSHSQFFVKDPGLAQAPKICPTNHRPSKRSIIVRRLPQEEKKWPSFYERAASTCCKACLHKVSRKYSKNWLRRTHIKSYPKPKIEYTLKPKNLRCQAVIFALYRTKAQMSTTFLRGRPWNLHVSNVPLPSLIRMCLFLFFSLEMWDPLRPKYPKKYENPNTWRGENKNKTVKRLGRGTLNACAKFQSLYLSKTAWTLDSEGIWGYKLEPACVQLVLTSYYWYLRHTTDSRDILLVLAT